MKIHSLYRSVFLLIFYWSGNFVHAQTTIDFNRDVRPILADKCFGCHGPDSNARKGNFRLDQDDGAIKQRFIHPKEPASSPLLRRVHATDEERMPPSESGKSLTEEQIKILERWVSDGAPYAEHWSFVVPRIPELPSVQRVSWVRNPIDSFVLAELERRGLKPSPEAHSDTLLRRLSLTLTGLPPSHEEMNRWEKNLEQDFLERWTEELFHSPRYAERMTLDWLDASRYADTHGYFGDTPRQAWPWRDWVLRAFSENMPFDRFTLEQIAGDLIENATNDQKVATAFLRNHMMTDETGVIDEEYRVSYVADRTETVATVWLGLTVGCAKCHDHKYDPISQKEFYELFAYFNNAVETGLIKATESPPPALLLPTESQRTQLDELKLERTTLEKRLAVKEPKIAEQEEEWLSQATLPSQVDDRLDVYFSFEDSIEDQDQSPATVRTVGTTKFDSGIRGRAGLFDATQYLEWNGPALDTDRPFALAVWFKPGSAPTGYILSKIDNSPAQRGFELFWYKAKPRLNLVRQWKREAIELIATDSFSSSEWHHLVVSYDGSGKASGFQVYIDGKHQAMSVRRDSLQGSVANDAPWQVAWKGAGLGYDGLLDEIRLYHRTLTEKDAHAIYWNDILVSARQTQQGNRSKQIKGLLRSYYLAQGQDEETRREVELLEGMKKRESEIQRQVASVAIMQERSQLRETYVLQRGQYDQPTLQVHPGLPAAFLPKQGSRKESGSNRLELAYWILSPENPLTSRVVVNRLWQMVFGEGLVRTVNDFGIQGESPTHPELLDWLARELIRSGWDLQHMLRLMVTSATFRQSSDFTASLLEQDPENRWFARGPRYRLQGETLRDQALAMSGLLVNRLGGPSVKPYQPPGLWEAVSYNGDHSYLQDHGANLYRRSLYTYWKRQAPPPDMLTFDGPTRETCVVRRPRTNTPLQSLVLLNDVTYVEAAIALAEKTVREGGTTDEERLDFCFRSVTGRRPNSQEKSIGLRFLQNQVLSYQTHPKKARDLLAAGEYRVDPSRAAHELAAWTSIALLFFNLDETITLN